MKTIFLFLFITIGSFNNLICQTIVNNYNLSKNKHHIKINSDFGSAVLGMGVNLNDLYYPEKANKRIINITDGNQREDLEFNSINSPIRPENVSFSSNITEILNTQELSTFLSTSLKGSYGVVSGKMAFQKSKKLTNEYHNMVIELTHTSSQPDISNYNFKLDTVHINKRFSKNEKRRAFLNKYGSHFITDIKYGFRISIIGSLSKRNSSEIQTFSASMKSAFSGGSAKGKITSTQRSFLSSKKVNIRAEITAGGLSTSQYLLNSFEEIDRFIKNFKEDKIKIYSGPVSFTASTYWDHLDDYPDLQNLFSQENINKLEANNGVPVGTVLPYKVPTNFKGEVTDIIPDGWELFTEVNDRFLMGTTNAEQIGNTGGSIEHSHSAHGVNYDLAPDASHSKDGALIENSNHLPPYYKIIFIIKI